MYQENPGDHAAGGAAKVLQVSVILYAPMPKTLGPEYRGSAFGLFSWWQDCISVQGYTSVFSTVAAPLAVFILLASSRKAVSSALPEARSQAENFKEPSRRSRHSRHAFGHALTAMFPLYTDASLS